jgi:membrane protease YdiL (CAAX protease family)
VRAIAVAIWLLAYNNLLNRRPWFDGAVYVALNLSATAALVGVGFGWLGLSAGDIGLWGSATDALWGVMVSAPAVATLVIAARRPRAAAVIADRRVERLDARALAFQLLIRIPFGTVLLEEVAFRGVLLGALRGLGDLHAAWLSAAAFGLWHIAPTAKLVDVNRPDAPRRAYVVAIVTAVALTTAAGAALAWLRLAFGGLAAPLAAHGTVNIGGTIAAVLAHRRLRQETQAGE